MNFLNQNRIQQLSSNPPTSTPPTPLTFHHHPHSTQPPRPRNYPTPPSQGETPLHYAIKFANEDSVNILLPATPPLTHSLTSSPPFSHLSNTTPQSQTSCPQSPLISLDWKFVFTAARRVDGASAHQSAQPQRGSAWETLHCSKRAKQNDKGDQRLLPLSTCRHRGRLPERRRIRPSPWSSHLFLTPLTRRLDNSFI